MAFHSQSGPHYIPGKRVKKLCLYVWIAALQTPGLWYELCRKISSGGCWFFFFFLSVFVHLCALEFCDIVLVFLPLLHVDWILSGMDNARVSLRAMPWFTGSNMLLGMPWEWLSWLRHCWHTYSIFVFTAVLVACSFFLFCRASWDAVDGRKALSGLQPF